MKSSPPKSSDGFRKLRALQREFVTGITMPLTSGHHMQPKWVDGKSTRKTVAKFVKPNDRLSSYERIEIYNRQYWYRLLDNLYEDFPGLRAVIGEKRFQALSIAYLSKYPSNTYALSNLGNRLEKFLIREPAWIARHPKLALDLVRLEWAHIVAFDAEALPNLEMDALLDSGDPATLRLSFQPYVTFLACDYPVDDFILALRRREEPRGEASNAVAEPKKRRAVKKVKLPKPEKIYLAVHRSDNSVYYKRLEPAAYQILVALKKGLPLQTACERALRRSGANENFGSTLQNWFTQWAAFGWFCRVE